MRIPVYLDMMIDPARCNTENEINKFAKEHECKLVTGFSGYEGVVHLIFEIIPHHLLKEED